MREIVVSIKNKIATAPKDAVMVCGNSDYIIRFDFDEEWNEQKTKTARFVYGGKFQDVVFEGDTCAAPVLEDTKFCGIGVFAGNIMTTTPALVKCLKAITDDDGYPAPPSEDVYNQIIELLNKTKFGFEKAEYQEKTPDGEGAKIVFTLYNGETLEMPLDDLISGLVSEKTLNEELEILGEQINEAKNAASSAKRTAESAQGILDSPEDMQERIPDAKNYASALGKKALGLVCGSANYGYGITVMTGTIPGMLSTVPTTDKQLEDKTGLYNVIGGAKLDKAVMEGLGNNKITWSDDYKASARKTIGATKLYRHNIFHSQAWLEGSKFDGTIVNASPTPITDDTTLRNALSGFVSVQGNIDGSYILQVVANAAFVTIDQAGAVVQNSWWGVSFAEGHTDTVTEV